MGSFDVLLNTIGPVSVTTAATINPTSPLPGPAWSNVTFYVNVTAITGTWDLLVRLIIGGSSTGNLAAKTGVTTTGLHILTLAAPLGAGYAIPTPFSGSNAADRLRLDNQVVLVAAGSITATFRMAAAGS